MPAKPRPKKHKVVGEKGITVANIDGGRPSKADEERLKIITNTLRLGAHFEIACFMADLNPRTVKDYMLRAREEPTGIYANFLSEITKALAQAEIRDLSVIDTASQGRPAVYQMEPVMDAAGNPVRDEQGRVMMKVQLDGDGKAIKLKNEVFPSWQASAWKLERKAPKRWGRYDRLAIDDMEEFGKDPRNKPMSEEEKIDAGEVEARAKRLQRVKRILDEVPEDSDLGEV